MVLFCVYAAGIGYLALEYHDPNLDNIYNIHLFFEHPVQMLSAALTLRYKPLNMDVLPLYILLMLVFPVILWALVRKPSWILAASIILYLFARHFDWNFRPIPMAPGTSTRSAGNCCSYSGHGLRSVVCPN